MKSIIYLPEIGDKNLGDSDGDYAERYMCSLDKMNPDKTKKYYLKEEELRFGLDDKFSVPVTSILEYTTSKDVAIKVCKIYKCSYGKELIEKFEKKNIFLKLTIALLILFSKTGVLLKTVFKRNSLSGKKKLEIFYFLSFSFMVILFAVLLFPALLTAFTAVLDKVLDESSPLSPKIQDKMTTWVTFSYWITTATALVTTIFPKFRNMLSDKATNFLCIDSYLTMGNNKLELTGKVESLVEKVSEEDSYTSLELHSYGFGAILLIDTMFPYGDRPNYRLSNEIKQIVTIRSPHDFISTYYPDYFKNRGKLEGKELDAWFNIYSDADVLSSNYETCDALDSDYVIVPEIGIPVNNVAYNVMNARKLGFWKYIRMFSLKTHKNYWGEGTATSNCLNLIMNNELSPKSA